MYRNRIGGWENHFERRTVFRPKYRTTATITPLRSKMAKLLIILSQNNLLCKENTTAKNNRTPDFRPACFSCYGAPAQVGEEEGGLSEDSSSRGDEESSPVGGPTAAPLLSTGGIGEVRPPSPAAPLPVSPGSGAIPITAAPWGVLRPEGWLPPDQE